MAKQSQNNLPEWENLLASISRLQSIVPSAVLVGGSASAIHAGHRFSYDHDHTVTDLKGQFDTVLQTLEQVSGWNTNRVNKPVLILGSLDGVETGVRNLIRSAPLETEEKMVSGVKIVLPTEAECLRIKVYLALTRNATRDYLDVAALADKMGPAASALALNNMDALYPQNNGQEHGSEWIVRTQIVKQFREPKPYDLDDVDLQEYKGVKPPYDSWGHVEKACSGLAMGLLADFTQALQNSTTPSEVAARVDLTQWKESVDRGEKPVIKKLPGLVR